MGSIPFDTLKTARRLESAGFQPKQAGDKLLRRDLTIRLGGMVVVAVGIILAAIRYILPPH